MGHLMGWEYITLVLDCQTARHYTLKNFKLDSHLYQCYLIKKGKNYPVYQVTSFSPDIAGIMTQQRRHTAYQLNKKFVFLLIGNLVQYSNAIQFKYRSKDL